MMNGLMIYTTNPETKIFNIGDYIQSLAAAQFFRNKIDVYLNREELNLYFGDKVRLIMNGWFLHQPENFPPSSAIDPLFVAFHLNSTAYYILEKKEVLDYFKLYEPIGCRDKKTAEVLREKGIDAYFSGCMTLTLGMTYSVEDRANQDIIFTDSYVPFEVGLLTKLKYCLYSLCAFSNILKISRKRYKKSGIKGFVKSCIFYQAYKQMFDADILVNAFHFNHELVDNFNSEDEKFAYAKEILEKYANAKLLITSKIHCALPCLSLRTPVIYIDTVTDIKESTCRLDGLLDLFNVIKWDGNRFVSDVFSQKITGSTKVVNKPNYRIYEENLISICRKFVQNS